MPPESFTSQETVPTLDRSKPPKAGRPSKTPFPGFQLVTLQNGVRVYVVENHQQPYVSFQLVVRSGAADDGAVSGLANFTGNLLLSGAGNLDANELAGEIDYLGATLDVITGRDESTVQLGALTKFLERGLELASDIALRPTFPDEEVDREQKQSLAGLIQNQSDPTYLVSVQFRREIHGRSPYGREIDGTEESLKLIGRDDCVGFHAGNYTAGNSFIVAAGDVYPDTLAETLNKRFGEWKGDSVSREEHFPINRPERPRVVVVDRPGSVQSALRVGTAGISRADDAYIPLMAMNMLFGGYFNSRINHNLRERHGYTYGARSILEAPQQPGSISATASVRTDVTDLAIEEILKEMRTISNTPVPDDELEMTKNFIIGSQSLQIETPGQVASFVRSIALYDLPHDYYQTLPERIRRLTSGELLDAARQHLAPDNMVIVVAGDASVIASKLERFGPVTVVNEKGIPL